MLIAIDCTSRTSSLSADLRRGTYGHGGVLRDRPEHVLGFLVHVAGLGIHFFVSKLFLAFYQPLASWRGTIGVYHDASLRNKVSLQTSPNKS